MRNKKVLEKGFQHISAKIPTYILQASAKNKDNIKCCFLSNDNKRNFFVALFSNLNPLCDIKDHPLKTSAKFHDF